MPKNEELENKIEDNDLNEKKVITSIDETKKEVETIVEKTEKSQKKSGIKTKVSLKEEPKVNESAVIEKIKSFIAKIAAMQEEALDEDNSKTVTKKEKKIKVVDKPNNTPQYMLEYYDLPYRYNETVVKVLAQTPKKLFVYWDISDNDREKYINTFGDDFFSKTYPVLLLYNEDKQYVREIPINDFANSWYINIDDPKTKYIIQLGRKFVENPESINMDRVYKENIIMRSDYLPFADSNMMEAPNDHVLLESIPDYILFRNVKTNEEVLKDIRDLKDVFGNNYDVEEFYKNHYKDELSDGRFDMANPSSKDRLTSSTFK